MKALVHRPQKAFTIVGALLASIAFFCASATNASAVTLGLAYSGQGYEQNAGDWDAIQHSGASVFRLQINWGTKNSQGWSPYDKAFELAGQRGVTILPFLYGNSNGSQQFPTEGEYGAWAQWTKEVVHRYGHNGSFWEGKSYYEPVQAWEIWNEPNFAANNPGGSTVQPENYARFLKSAAQAVWSAQLEKSANAVDVLFAGLFSAGEESSGLMGVRKFLEKADNVAETGSYFNQLSLHPYAFLDSPGKTRVEKVKEKIQEGRTALNDFFSSGKQIAITELGWAAEPFELGVSETQQASLLTDSFDMIESNSATWNVSSLYWYFYRDTNGSAWAQHAGLRAEDGRFRPSWHAYQAQTGAPPWTPPSPMIQGEDDNVLGPHVVGQSNGTIDAFYRTPSGALGHSWTQGGSWGEQPISGTALHASSVPHPVVQPGGAIDVFWRTSADGLGHAWLDSAGWHAETLSGTLASEPHPAAQPDGTIDVFYKTPSGGLGHNWYQPGGSWSSNTLSGSVASDPYPVAQESGTVDVFYRTSSGALGHSWTQGGSWSEQPISGTSLHSASVPHPVVQENGTIDVFWRKPDNGLGHAWIDGTGWHANTLAGSLNGDPHPVAQPDGTIDVFFRNWSGELGHDWYEPGGSWNGNVLTSGLTSEPYPVAQTNGTIDVFWKTVGDGVGHAWTQGGSWSANTVSGTMEPGAAPHAVAQPDGTVDVLYRSPSGGLGHSWYEAGGSWSSNTLSGSLAAPPAPGKFSTSSKWSTWSTAYTIQFADVNGDGKEDIVGRNSSGDVQVGLSTGSGFATSTKWSTFSTAYTFALADVNGDGKADAVGRNSSAERQVGLSTGSAFATPTKWTTWGSEYSFELADPNGDGKYDTVGRHPTTGDLRAGLSTGSGFSASTTWATWGSAYTMHFDDTDGDGDEDVAGRNPSTGELRVGVSNGSSAFTGAHRGYWSGNYTLQFDDVDGDGKADAAGRHTSSGDVRVGLSTGSAFGPPGSWSSWSTAYSFDLADVNGDGRKDAVGRNSSGDVQVGLSAAS